MTAMTRALAQPVERATLSVFPAAPGVARAHGRGSEAIGLVGLMLLALGLAPSKSAQTLGLVLMLAALLWNGRLVWRALNRDPVFALLLVWLVYIAARAGVAAWQYPDTAALQLDYFVEYLRLIGIVLTGWWLGGSARAVKSAAGIALAGLLLYVVLDIGMPGGLSGLPSRGELSINAQHLGLLALTAIIGLVALAPEWWTGAGGRPGPFRVGAWLLCLLVALVLVFLSGSRTIWALTLAAALAMAAVQTYRALAPHSRRPVRRGSVIALTIAVVVVGGVVAANHERALSRVTYEAGQYDELLRGDFAAIDTVSMGSRVHLWGLAFDRIADRPVFGWGPGMPSVLIERSQLPERIRERFDHLHNSYLEVAVALGGVGLLLFLAIWVALFVRVGQALRRDAADGPLTGFVALSVIVFLLASMTEAYVVRQLGWSYTALIGGMLYSLALGGRHAAGETG